MEQLLAAVEGGVHRQTLADNGESKGKKNAERYLCRCSVSLLNMMFHVLLIRHALPFDRPR